MKVFVKLMDCIDRTIEAFLVAMLAFLVIVVFGQVLSRTFHFTAPVLEELARYTNIWIAFLAGAYGMRKNTLIKVDSLHMILKGRWNICIVEISRIVSLIFIILMIYSSMLLVSLGVGQISPSLRIEMSFVYAVMPVSFVVAFLNWWANSAQRWEGALK